MGSAPCEFLQWDSDFFARRIARVTLSPQSPARAHLTPETARDILEWCGRNQIDCLYVAVASDDPETVRIAESNGFDLVDNRLTFAIDLASAPALAASIRPARDSDLPALTAIASNSHRDSRFYHDKFFLRERCDQFYRVWIERSCQGWADKVFVAEMNGEPAGYVTCHLSTPDSGSIGLLAVSEHCRGQGLGPSLVNAALEFFVNSGRQHASVVTQGRNLASQRLYRRCGFHTDSVLLYYHRWFPKPVTG